MIKPRLVLCSGVNIAQDDPLREERRILELSTRGRHANVNVRIEDVAKALMGDLSPRLVDLLEIAAYVFTADCATTRGAEWTDDDTTEPWDRNIKFVIPIRDLHFWAREEVGQLLTQILQFLSDDNYIFQFRELKKEPSKQGYLEFGEDEDWPFYGVDRVFMFSGGLDSLAGAAEAAAKGQKLVLVSHRPVATQSSRQRELFETLQKTYPVPMIHVQVWINKEKRLGREHTQRTRSFLYSALGTIVAMSVKAAGIRFFENGIVSLNFPLADEALRARASRTTHPIVLDLFSRLYGLVAERRIEVDNPFLFKTKSEVISIIAENGGSELIKRTCSCAHQGFFKSKLRWHCGMMSRSQLKVASSS